MKNIILKSVINEPIYHAKVLVIIARDAEKAYQPYAVRFDDDKGNEPFTSLTVANDYMFALFFHADCIGSETIAHELKHLVDFIMEWIGAKSKRPSKKTKIALEEPEAYLTGYLHKRFYALLKRHKIRLQN